VTPDEAAQILGPDLCARLDAFAAAAPPLSERQRQLLKNLFTVELPDRVVTPDVA
jgi:hypothetical protein